MSCYKKPKKHEALLWSLALPGFGEFLNRRLSKGSILILLEFLVNALSNLNLAIIYSFKGEINPYSYILFVFSAFFIKIGRKLGIDSK